MALRLGKNYFISNIEKSNQIKSHETFSFQLKCIHFEYKTLNAKLNLREVLDIIVKAFEFVNLCQIKSTFL